MSVTSISSAKDIGDIVSALRKHQGIRQADMAGMIGASHEVLAGAISAIANDPSYRQNHERLNHLLNDGSALKANYGNLIDLGIQRRKQAVRR